MGKTGTSDIATDAKPLEPGSISARERRAVEAKRRVKDEIAKRSGCAGALPAHVGALIFEPKGATETLALVEAKLKTAFSKISFALANGIWSHSEYALTSLCKVRIDEAMGSLDYSADQKRVISTYHKDLIGKMRDLEDQCASIRKCTSKLRQFRK